MTDTAPQTPLPAEDSKTPRWRRILCAALVVLGCVLAPISVHAVWIHSTLLSTDQYVSTVGPLAGNPSVQNALANRVTNTLINNSKIESRLKRALPAQASFAVPVITNALDGFVHRAALQIVQSPKFEQLWKALNRRIHTRLVDVLRGQGKFVNRQGQVGVDIQPVIDKVNALLTKRGIDGLQKASGQKSHEVVLFSSSSLRQTQSAVRVLDDVAYVLPILTALVFAGAILASTRRRRTVLRAALGLGFATLLFLTVWKVTRGFYVNALPSGISRPAAGAIYDQLLGFLFLALRTLLAFAVVVALGAWLAGPARLATRIRIGARSLVARTPGQSAISPKVSESVDGHRTPFRLLVVGLGLLVLVVLNHPGPVAVVVTAIVVLVCLGLIELVGRGATTASDTTNAPR